MTKSNQKPFKKGYKFPIYPTKEQIEFLNKTFGCCRYVYNRALAEAKQEYTEYLNILNSDIPKELIRPNVSGFSLCKKLPFYKIDPNSLWLTEVSSKALQSSLLDLGDAFTNFFRKKKGYPKFKKKINRQSFSLDSQVFKIIDNQFFIAKCKDPIKVVFSRELPSAPSSCTISKTPSGKYYVSFLCEYYPSKTTGMKEIGIDLGIKDFIVTSDGDRVANPKYYTNKQKKLKRLQQSLSRKQKGSSNRNKARILLAKQHEKITNSRKDFHHQLSRRLVNENQVIGLENLMVKNMVKNKRLAKAISDAGWSEFTKMLEYKAIESQHCILVYMNTFFASSHFCNETMYRLERKLKLSERSWICPFCGENHDRDINAALVIRYEALKVLLGYSREEMAGTVLLRTGNY